MTQLSLFDDEPALQEVPPPCEEFIPLEDYGLDAPQQEAFVPKVLQPAPPAPYRLFAGQCDGRIQPLRFYRSHYADGSVMISADRKSDICPDFWEPVGMVTKDMGDTMQGGIYAYVDDRLLPYDFVRWLVTSGLIVPTTRTMVNDGHEYRMNDVSRLIEEMDKHDCFVPGGKMTDPSTSAPANI